MQVRYRAAPYSDVFGGDKRDRTADLYNAIVALSQLSYTPMLFGALPGIRTPSYGLRNRCSLPMNSLGRLNTVWVHANQ